MCWSADASILSFIVGCLGIVLAAFKGVSPFMILFFSTIVAMQLVEYVVWTYGENPDTNFGASLAAASLLALQPVASILTVSQSYIPITAYLILAFIAHLVDSSRDARSFQERYRITAEPHLVWHWLTPPPIFSLIVYFLFLLVPLVLSQQFLLLGVVLAALAFSLLFGTGGKGLAAEGGVAAQGRLEAARATGVASPYWGGSVWCYAIHSIVVVLCLIK
jgi:hypothetical protein